MRRTLLIITIFISTTLFINCLLFDDLSYQDTLNTSGDGNTGSWGNYTLNRLPYVRQNGYQDIQFSNSKTETSEFLILSASHGNPPADQIKYPAVVQGGGWNKITYAGNDDKSTEIWFRQITSANKNIPGRIDSKNAAAKISILVYNEKLTTGNVAEKNQISKAKISITNSGTGPFLIVASSDNGGESDIADIQYGYKSDGFTPGDDMTFIYLRYDKSFTDSSVGIRGAIASIQLKNN